MAVLDGPNLKFFVLIDKYGIIKRTIGDGDVKRVLLCGASLDSLTSEFPSTGCISLHEGHVESNLLIKFMRNPSKNVVVKSDGYNKAVKLVPRDELFSVILLSPPHVGSSKLQIF